MSAFKVQYEKIENDMANILEDCLAPLAAHYEKVRIVKAIFQKQREILHQTGVVITVDSAKLREAPQLCYAELDDAIGKENFPENRQSSAKTAKQQSKKKTVSTLEPIGETPPRSQRPRRNAFKEATQSLTSQSSLLDSRRIKKEKISMIKVKTEPIDEDMPPPPVPLKRALRKKPTRKIKEEKMDEDECVVVQDPVISLSDSDDDNAKRVKKKKDEALSMGPSNTCKEVCLGGQNADATYVASQQDETSKSSSIYEDALNINEIPPTASVDAPQEVASSMNLTHVIDKPTIPAPEDMMTDDESDQEIQVVRKRKPEIFSPYGKSPVKKKVEAFEKLKEQVSGVPVSVTRLKACASTPPKDKRHQLTGNVKEKAKIFTPSSIKFQPSVCSTLAKPSTKRVPSRTPSQSNCTIGEYQKRREKEEGAIKKRDAQLAAAMEEKRKRREERQLKAQQQREVLEKQKLKSIEEQKLKEEKHRQLLLEQEQRKQKIREEAEKKRILAKQRAMEEKKKEQELSVQMSAKKNTVRTVPEYIRVEAPLLPSQDCFDSDDDERPVGVQHEPTWSKNVTRMLNSIAVADVTIKNTFFSCKPQTADLREIFEGIDPRKLKRSSSVYWHNPPRFTTFQRHLENHDETEEFLEEDSS